MDPSEAEAGAAIGPPDGKLCSSEVRNKQVKISLIRVTATWGPGTAASAQDDSWIHDKAPDTQEVVLREPPAD